MSIPLIIAHRGASFDAPENTLAAFELAWRQNADGAEGDFHLTRDNQIVCIHDASTKRTADREMAVARSTLAELATLDINTHKHHPFPRQFIPTLGQILKILPADKLFYIEIKSSPQILPFLKQTLADSKVPLEQLRLICFDAEVIVQSRRILPDIKTHWLVDYSIDPVTGLKTPTLQTILKTLEEVGANGLNSQADLSILTPAFIAELHNRGLESAAWTVDDLQIARALVQAGIGSITTNRPAYVASHLLP